MNWLNIYRKQHLRLIFIVSFRTFTITCFSILFFDVGNAIISPISEKLLTQSHPDIAGMAESKQNIGYHNSESNRCTEIYLRSSPVPVLNHISSKNVRLVTFWNKDITATSVFWRNNDDPVQMNIVTKEFDIRKHFCVFVVAIKINSFVTLACYTICCTVKICQIGCLRGG